jgi:hypothetical protein
MSSKVDMINALGQAEVARKKAQRSAYVPDLFLLERLNFFTQIPKQCPQSQACFGSFLARQLDSGVSSLGAKLPKLEEYWLKAATWVEPTVPIPSASSWLTTPASRIGCGPPGYRPSIFPHLTACSGTSRLTACWMVVLWRPVSRS